MPRAALAILSVTLFAGCSNEQDKLQDAERAVHSWRETIRMSVQCWQNGAAPTLYVRQVMKAAREELDSQAKELASMKSMSDRRKNDEQKVADLKRCVDEILAKLNGAPDPRSIADLVNAGGGG
jgi:hypothetical protein